MTLLEKKKYSNNTENQIKHVSSEIRFQPIYIQTRGKILKVKLKTLNCREYINKHICV